MPGIPVLVCNNQKIKVPNIKRQILTFHKDFQFPSYAQCLKITEKVSFNIASEASYGYILSGRKFIKNAKKWSNLTSFWQTEATFQTVLPATPPLVGQKLMKNAKIEKFRCDILGDFQTLCGSVIHA